ncbi:progestin and adipoQ receptor family member 4-like isoform X2 [Oncorhynchus mykiss]|uniref:progestin and adipoQ receptor family member 4-like isoform X2 n=1 Tax=Oncorhynchus mykiss TaxID=8022 RepID=UPI00187756E0|nr:progestin and adipoQ receptor family member 4-like isoform X2 [Oncorhynchus mykiss]
MACLHGPRLLNLEKTPPHLQFNDLILTGYRPISTFQGCIRSLFYLHNEFGNIYTHGNVLYHTFMNHEGGEPIYDTLLSLDMVGVCLVNTLGCLPIIYITLMCYPGTCILALLSYSLISAWGILCATTARSNYGRLRAFIWQALFRVLLFLFRWLGDGVGSPASLRLFFTMDMLAIMGGLVNLSRVPERFSPGLFDYWCNSHQIMHVLVICSIIYMHWGMLEDLAWIKTFQCPVLE